VDKCQLCLLDLTAAFDTVDHELLIQRLQRTFEISGSALAWFESYLSDRTHCVVADSVMSQVIHVSCSVPQGSVLGPLLFLLYTEDLAELAARFGVTLHAYADNNQLYLSCRTDDANLSVAALERCVTAISLWMSANRLKLNMEKTEWLWTGTGSNLDRLPESARRLTMGNDVVDVADAVRVLGVVVTPDLSLDKHVTRSAPSASSSCVSCAEFDGHSTMSLWRL